MDIEKLNKYSFEEIRSIYKEYLKRQNIANATINTAYTDTFYMWRKGSSDIFWDVVTSTDFESKARKELLIALNVHSKGNASTLINGYMSHLRRFRDFLASDMELSLPVSKINMKASVSNKKFKTFTKMVVPKPSEYEVEKYLKNWETLENYQLQEMALDKLFFKLCPNNNNIEDVLLKAATLNDFYSTNIFSIYPVAKHICSLDIDVRLKSDDITLVSDIQAVTIGGIEKNFYSFATKYCSHHNPLEFPIYDSYVDAVLRYFKKIDNFALFSDADLKDYVKFKRILIDFKEFYSLEKYNLKQIDQYIWQLGKEYFPKNYKKKN